MHDTTGEFLAPAHRNPGSAGERLCFSMMALWEVEELEVLWLNVSDVGLLVKLLVLCFVFSWCFAVGRYLYKNVYI